MKLVLICIYLVICMKGEMIEDQVNELKKEIERKKIIIQQMKMNDENSSNNSIIQIEQRQNKIIQRIEKLENSIKEIKKTIFSNQNVPIIESKHEESVPRFKEKETVKLENNKFQNMDDDELEKFIQSTKTEPKSSTIYKEP